MRRSTQDGRRSEAPAALAALGEFVAKTRWEAIPEAARGAARSQLLDIVAALHAAVRSGEASKLFAGYPGGSGPSTAIAGGGRLGPAEAAFVNAAFSMAQDYDDIVWMGHTGHSAVFGALAVAEAEARTTRDLVTAIVVANEVAGRLGASSVFGPMNGQMWTFIHLVGAAAAASSLLGLDAERATHALAIALAQPTYALQPAFFGPTSKLLAAAIPTQTGVQAAYLARAGMTGAPHVLDDRRGFWRAFTFRALPEMLGGLGEVWLVQTLAIKTSPACHYFQTACEAASRIVSKERLELRDVRRVTVATTKLGDEVTRFAAAYAPRRPDLSPIGASFDLGLAVAITLHAGRFTGDESRPEWLEANAADLRAWYAKIGIEHDPELTMRVLDGARAIPSGRAALSRLGVTEWVHVIRSYREEYGSTLLRPSEAVGWARAILRRLRRSDPPARPDGAIPLYFPNRVTVEREDGARLEEEIDLPAGSIASPSGADSLAKKLEREIGPRLGEAAAKEILAMGLDVERFELAVFVRAISGS